MIIIKIIIINIFFSAVNITIDPSETPEFLTQEGKLVKCNCPGHHWNCDSEDDDKIFTLCNKRFTDQEVYWEVTVAVSYTVKLSWFIGVASDAAEKTFNVPFTPQNEFWVLCFEKEKGLYIRGQTEPILIHCTIKTHRSGSVFKL